MCIFHCQIKPFMARGTPLLSALTSPDTVIALKLTRLKKYYSELQLWLVVAILIITNLMIIKANYKLQFKPLSIDQSKF